MQNRYVFRTTALLMLAASAASCAAPISPVFPLLNEKGAFPAPAEFRTTLPAELASVHPALFRAWQGDDAASLRPYFAPNAVITTSTGYYRGWEEIAARWLAPTLRMTSGFIAEPTSFTYEDGDIVERGRYATSLEENGRTVPARGAYAQRWQRDQDGRWRIVSANIFAPEKQ